MLPVHLPRPGSPSTGKNSCSPASLGATMILGRQDRTLSRQTRFVFGDRVMSEVSISNVESQLVMGMRKRGTYAEIRPMIVRIHRYIEANGAQIGGAADVHLP